MTITAIRSQLASLADEQRAAIQMRFFKTGPGEYGEGDRFIGVRVPELRRLSRLYRGLNLTAVQALLKSEIHEERHLALFIMVLQFNKGTTPQQRRIYDLYLAKLAYINNWDLVDCSAEHIVGGWLEERPKARLYKLAGSVDL